MTDLELLLHGYRLTTARILYYLPDQPLIIGPDFIWQNYDLVPKFPVLHDFLGFWEDNIEGKIHSVEVTVTEGLRPARFRFAKAMLELR
jgi:uncharacterized protein Usg